MPYHGLRGNRGRDQHRKTCPPPAVLGAGLASGIFSQSVEADEWVKIIYSGDVYSFGSINFIFDPVFRSFTIFANNRGRGVMSASSSFVPSQADRTYTLSLQIRINNTPLMTQTDDFIGSSASTIWSSFFEITEPSYIEIYIRSSIAGTARILTCAITEVPTFPEL